MYLLINDKGNSKALDLNSIPTVKEASKKVIENPKFHPDSRNEI